MSKRKIWIAVLAVILALSACAPVVPVETTTVPTETTAPPTTQPVTEPALTLVALDARDVADCTYEEFGTTECTYWKNPDEDYRAPQTMTVTFEGKTYTGTYYDTRSKVTRTSPFNQYEFDGGWFKVDAESGQLVGFNAWIKTGDLPQEGLSQEECRKIADSIAHKYADLSQYEVTITNYDDQFYGFRYNRYINGVRTTDEVRIVISIRGEVDDFGIGTTDAFSLDNLRSDEAKRTIEVLSSEKADEALSEKIDAIYTSGFEKRYPGAKVTCTYTCSRNYLVSLPDGTFGRLYEGTVEAQIEKETGAARDSALFRILVKYE